MVIGKKVLFILFRCIIRRGRFYFFWPPAPYAAGPLRLHLDTYDSNLNIFDNTLD